jgi:hypothetical protein
VRALNMLAADEAAAASSSHRHEISQGDGGARDLLQVTFPLTVLGGIMGKNTRMEFNPPTRTTKCALPSPLNIILRCRCHILRAGCGC